MNGYFALLIVGPLVGVVIALLVSRRFPTVDRVIECVLFSAGGFAAACVLCVVASVISQFLMLSWSSQRINLDPLPGQRYYAVTIPKTANSGKLPDVAFRVNGVTQQTQGVVYSDLQANDVPYVKVSVAHPGWFQRYFPAIDTATSQDFHVWPLDKDLGWFMAQRDQITSLDDKLSGLNQAISPAGAVSPVLVKAYYKLNGREIYRLAVQRDFIADIYNAESGKAGEYEFNHQLGGGYRIDVPYRIPKKYEAIWSRAPTATP